METREVHHTGTCRYDTCTERLRLSDIVTAHMHCSEVSEKVGKNDVLCRTNARTFSSLILYFSTRPVSHWSHVLKLALFVLGTSVTSALSICTLSFSRSTQRTGTLYCSLYQRLQSVPDTNTVAYECALCIDRIQSTFLVSCSARSSIIVL